MHLAKRNATWNDLRALPGHFVAELIDGDLYASDQPSVLHAFVRSGLGFTLAGETRGGALTDWLILHRPEHHLFGNVLVPDLAGWRRARLAQLPERWEDAPPPDWVCEVVDPTSARVDRGRKLWIYHRAGVGHVWLVDPSARGVEIYRHHPEGWLVVGLHTGDAPLRAEPFDAVEFDPTEWWGGPEEPPPAG